ncbi:MAG: hypothetical protein GY789_11155, partial [Hyphomicrobiales bacterium]|nr:hypothetical protein [Hyphomicrobiales bacterium]
MLDSDWTEKELSRMNPEEFMKLYVAVKMEKVHGVRIRQDFKVNQGFDPGRNVLDIPIVINNFNRLSCLKLMIAWLKANGYFNLYIIDNHSDYPPLLDYYRTAGLRVFYLDRNVGYLALWKTGLRYRFLKNYYVYTDPDILPVAQCPQDFLDRFRQLLDRYP